MKYKVGDEVLVKGIIEHVGGSGILYRVKFDYWDTWAKEEKIQPSTTVWRDGAVEQPYIAIGDYVFIMPKSNIGDIGTAWGGQLAYPRWYEVYWLPADEFPMPRLPEPVIEPCPFCNGECEVLEPEPFMDEHWVECTNRRCRYAGATSETPAEAIAAHNELARKARA